jgi:molecular chaperone DnaK (HSP70)
MVIDEASAAAFYFAYRDFINGPGQFPAFRYLYPSGMHMLLYDCGGGTTDLSLVRLEGADEDHLKISVLGRAGHRTFGGDFITEQVFRLLKMKLAALRGELPPVPAPAKVPDFVAGRRTAQSAAQRAEYPGRHAG